MSKAQDHSISRKLTWMNMLVSSASYGSRIIVDMAFREAMVRNLPRRLRSACSSR